MRVYVEYNVLYLCFFHRNIVSRFLIHHSSMIRMKANYNAHVNNAKSETPLYTVLQLGFVNLSKTRKCIITTEANYYWFYIFNLYC